MVSMRLSASILVILLGIWCFGSVNGKSPRLLIALDSLELKSSHSKFLNLAGKNCQTTVVSVDDASTKLKEWDVWNYDKLIIFGGKKKLADGLKPTIVKEFVDSGRDLFLALDENASTELRGLVRALGVKPASPGEVVIDHFNPAKLDTGSHTAVLTSSLASLRSVYTSELKEPVAFQGIGFSISRSSHTAFPALVGSSTAYSGPVNAPVKKSEPISGYSLALVALVQARNNARAAILGSTLMCSDAFFASYPSNSMVCSDLYKWSFHKKGVLNASNFRHTIIEGSLPGAENPSVYRTNDEVKVELDIKECEEGGCKPFSGATDLQIEFVMLDPYIRKTMQDLGNGTYAATVKIPDVYGVFKWIVDYHHPGLSWINDVKTIPVRPYRHYEYERFIMQASPYYISVAAMMVGFWVLGISFFG